MVLTAGMRLGPYEIVGAIGAGGMGEVYRARDSRLRREVAVKVLPQSFAGDADRLARFEREARLLASVNHAHIASIYGLEEGSGFRALVLELVEGETVEERRRRPIPVREALSIAQQIAEALEAAHERGIIHRDLKPANVKITPEGCVKVLDFGLAKNSEQTSNVDASSSATLERATEGMILGTAGYMSPEQARGTIVDKRTDIWAFGCVLFEMLAGELAFPGKTISDRIAAILERDPAWDRLPEATPSAVRRLIRRCLEKDPKRRLRDIGDARMELEEALSHPAEGDAAPVAPALITRRTAMTALASAAVGAAGVGVFTLRGRRGSVRRNLTRFTIAMPEGEFHQMSFNDRVAISPDGTCIAFNTSGAQGSGNLYMQALRDLLPKRVEGVPGGTAGFFSPDGRWLGFMMTKPTLSLRKIALSGGASIPLCPAGSFGGATWADDDTVYLVPEVPGGVVSVPGAGGQPKEIVKIDAAHGERVVRYPSALPGGKAILLTVATADTESFDDAHIAAISMATGEKKVVIERGMHARYSPSGHLVFAREGKLLAARFDPDRLEVSGQPFHVLDGVLMSRNTGAANFDISASGDLVYIPGAADGGARTLVWVDRNGNAEPLPLPVRSYLHPRISPDSRRLAIEIEGSNHDVYVYDFVSGVLSNLTNDGISHWPVWSPNGSDIGYRSGTMGRFRLWQIPADRSHAPRQVQADGVSQSAESYSPDGRVLAYTVAEISKPARITVVELQGPRTPRALESAKYAQGSVKFSPDGRWLAYCSNESGKPQVYAQAYPGPGAKIQVSSEGGTDPVWKRDGSELFYRNGDNMMAVPVSLASGFVAGRPQKLWSGHYSHGMSSSCGAPGATSSNYDVTADGSRFLMIVDRDQDAATSRQIVVALGWADELNRLSRA